MCLDPLSLGIAQFAIGAATSVATFVAQGEQYESNQENALRANEIQQRQLTRRQQQEQALEAQKKRLLNIEEAEKVSEAKVAGTARGVAGISLDNLVADIHRQAANNRTVIDANTRMTVQQIQEEKKGAAAQTQSRIDSVAKPNALGLVAGIGGAALKGYSAYDKFMG